MTISEEHIFEIVARGGTWKFAAIGREMYDRERAYLRANSDFAELDRDLYLLNSKQFDAYLSFRRALRLES